MTQQTLVAKITRNVSNCFGSHEEEFDKVEVSSFDEALEMCKAVGSFHGMIEQCVEFIEIDTTNMTAEFKVNGRMRYEGDTFTLSVTTKQNDMAQQKHKHTYLYEVFEYLNYKQLFTLCWWELFNRKKLNLFYEGLKKGKSPIFAYKDAKSK